MRDKISLFKDKDGFTYKHPERDCKACLNHPCVPKMEELKSNFAAYGCSNYKEYDVRRK